VRENSDTRALYPITARHDDFRRFLREAAQAGVDVRVITASRDQTDLKSVFYASRARYAELLRAGIRIYEYTPAMMHAKTIVADGMWSAIGFR